MRLSVCRSQSLFLFERLRGRFTVEALMIIYFAMEIPDKGTAELRFKSSLKEMTRAGWGNDAGEEGAFRPIGGSHVLQPRLNWKSRNATRVHKACIKGIGIHRIFA